MRIPLLRLLPWLILAGFALVACSSDQDAPAKAIQDYLAAKVDSNVDKMTQLSCPDFEFQAQVEATSFASMDAALDNVTCKTSGTDGSFTLVSCAGQIVTTYQGENRTWSVSDHPYRVIEDGGTWLMCGYGN